MSFSIQSARSGDLPEIMKLLSLSNLPIEDLESADVLFKIIRGEDGSLLGCAGLEVLGHDGLLRSFAVVPEKQNLGLGRMLLAALQVEAKEEEVQTWHLLTTTAESYFKKIGFERRERKEAPDLIQQTSEFTSVCPSSAAYMSKSLI